MPEIIIALMSGPRDGDFFTFDVQPAAGRPAEISIGRREGCDVCLSYDSQVSREHALVLFDGERFWLEDTGSTNGTFIGEQRISGRAALEPGQLFRVGRTWLSAEPLKHFTTLGLDDDLPF